MTVLSVLDAAGRRRSPATLPGYHAGRPPRNKGSATRPTPTHGGRDRRGHAPHMRRPSRLARTSDDRRPLARRPAHPGSARACRARPRPPARIDPGPQRQGRPTTRGRHGRVGWEQLRPWLNARAELPVGPLFCIIDGPARGDRGQVPPFAPSSADSPPAPASGGASPHTSYATRMPSSWPARACR
jgi:hypothetical protein